MASLTAVNRGGQQGFCGQLYNQVLGVGLLFPTPQKQPTLLGYGQHGTAGYIRISGHSG